MKKEKKLTIKQVVLKEAKVVGIVFLAIAGLIALELLIALLITLVRR